MHNAHGPRVHPAIDDIRHQIFRELTLMYRRWL